MRKSASERIAEIQEEIRQRENRVKEILRTEKDRTKKERTHRLCERGALLESLIANSETLTGAQIKDILEIALATPDALEMLKLIAAQNKTEDAQNAERVGG
ncbi:MAG: DUF3847 domain-containing protein [Oscillospiraceae bacterium]|jgi:hypothetical protein|nr:DUF3847 domain-containing protein [Oscillospiraceae bacterium]